MPWAAGHCPMHRGASLQLKQMYARGSIQAADANILATYGINAYRVLADRLGVDQKVVRKLGEKGLLGPDSIRLFFRRWRNRPGEHKRTQ